MKTTLKLAILLSLGLSLSLPALVAARDIAVIANSHFPKNAVTLGYLKKVYLGKKKDEGGQKIRPLDYHDHHALKRNFIANVLSSTVGRYRAYWLKQLFREGLTPPDFVKDAESLLKAVKKTKGAIGYLYVDELQDRQGIKILLVIK